METVAAGSPSGSTQGEAVEAELEGEPNDVVDGDDVSESPAVGSDGGLDPEVANLFALPDEGLEEPEMTDFDDMGLGNALEELHTGAEVHAPQPPEPSTAAARQGSGDGESSSPPEAGGNRSAPSAAAPPREVGGPGGAEDDDVEDAVQPSVEGEEEEDAASEASAVSSKSSAHSGTTSSDAEEPQFGEYVLNRDRRTYHTAVKYKGGNVPVVKHGNYPGTYQAACNAKNLGTTKRPRVRRSLPGPEYAPCGAKACKLGPE